MVHAAAAQYAWPFNEPVDLKRYPDYTQKVQQPLDLGTIRSRVDAGAYSSPRQVTADVALVWANARAYNAVGSDVWHIAEQLQVRLPRGFLPQPPFRAVSVSRQNLLGSHALVLPPAQHCSMC